MQPDKIPRIINISVATLLLIASFVVGATPETGPELKPRGKYRFALLVPRNDPFWRNSIGFANAAAKDLNVELHTLNFDGSTLLQMSLLDQALKSGLDGVIFSPYKNTAEEVLQLTENYQVPTFLINSRMVPDKFPPRTRYPYWVGEMTPDNSAAGATLIHKLVETAHRHAIKDIHILAIEGEANHETSLQRRKGLDSVIRHLPNIKSQSLLSADWDPEQAASKFRTAFMQNPKINVVWAANDNMALAVSRVLKEIKPDHPVLVGGIDWEQRSLEAINNQALHVSVGGHFLESSWALVLLHDYLQGRDFANEGLRFTSSMSALTPQSSNVLAPLFETNINRLNFRNISKHYTPSLIHYPLELSELVKKLAHSNKATPAVKLNSNETKWLEQNQRAQIRLGVDPSWAPFEFMSPGQVYSGMCSEYVHIISERLNLNMRPLALSQWSEVMDKARSKELDVLPCVVKTKQRSKYLNFTKPYISFPMVILTRGNTPFVPDIDSVKGTIAVIDGYYTYELLTQDHPDKKYLVVNNLEEALKAVNSGDADAYVGNLAAITYSLQKLGIQDLKVSGHTPYRFELAFAVRKDWPQLVGILDKHLDSLSETTKSRINSYWVNVRVEREYNWQLIWPYAAAALTIMIFILVWNRRLEKEISIRRTAEIALTEKETKFRTLFNSSSDAVMILDREHFTDCNPATLKMFKMNSVAEFIKCHPADLSPQTQPDGQSSLQAADTKIKQALDEGSNRFEWIHQRKDGSRFPAEVLLNSMEIAGRRKLQAVVRDITTRKNIENALVRQQKSLKYLNEIAALWHLNLDEQLRRALEVGVHHFGMDNGVISKVSNNNYVIEQLVSPEQKMRNNEVLNLTDTFCQQTLDSKSVICISNAANSSYQQHPAYQQKKIASYIGCPLWVNGKLYGSLAFFDRRAFQREFDEADHDFMQLLSKWVNSAYERHFANQMLVQAKNSAEHANQAKSSFLSRMSHELRTPLNAILGFTQLLMEQPLSEQSKADTQEIYKAGQHLLSLINDILDIAKIEAGRLKLSIDKVSLADVITECLLLTEPLAERNQITLKVSWSNCKNKVIFSDYTRIKQVLLNLLSNAVKYNHKHGKVLIRCYTHKGMTHVNIIDSGIGIKPERISDLFQPFNRLDAEHSHIEGTGIGLVITKQLVEHMGGHIRVNSIPGKGSKFTILLPADNPDEAQPKPPEETTALEANKTQLNKHKFTGKLLAVEDNPTNQLLLKAQLSKLEIPADFAQDGEEALALWLENNYTLILSDIHMPNMNGYELCQKIRNIEKELESHTPMIAITANAMAGDAERCMEVGFDDFLAKPVDLTQLRSVLYEWSAKNSPTPVAE